MATQSTAINQMETYVNTLADLAVCELAMNPCSFEWKHGRDNLQLYLQKTEASCSNHASCTSLRATS